MFSKKDFKVGDRVEFFKTSSDELDGTQGEIIGKASENVIDFYIVFLDKPFTNYISMPNSKAVVMIETCLKRV